MSLIIYDGDPLDCWHYTSHVFDAYIGRWWHCEDDEVTEISDFPEGVYTRESQK